MTATITDHVTTRLTECGLATAAREWVTRFTQASLQDALFLVAEIFSTSKPRSDGTAGSPASLRDVGYRPVSGRPRSAVAAPRHWRVSRHRHQCAGVRLARRRKEPCPLRTPRSTAATACCLRRRTRWSKKLLAAKRALELPRALRKLDIFEAILIDDIGYVQQSPEEAEVLVTLLAERYERRSVMITSYLVFSQWERIFKDQMANIAPDASRDRAFVEDVYSSRTEGGSLRLIQERGS